MPPFDHLNDQEIDALLAYLASIASVELAEPHPGTLHESALHVGEQLIKATCQICHDAVPGQWRRAEDKEIPPLSDFTRKYAVSEFVHKVRSGTVEVGETRGRMPIFEYLSEPELEAAYVYLIAYPPRQNGD